MVYFKEKGKSQFVRALFVASLVLSGSSLYADQAPNNSATSYLVFPFKPPVNFNWQGPYAGGYLGSSWTSASVSTNLGIGTGSSYFSSPLDITSVNQHGSNSPDPDAQLAGI